MAEYIKSIEEHHFDPVALDLYWRFITERQWVYVRRVLLQREFPWTTDHIMSAEFITNNYRELDPGTQYVIEHILTMPKRVDVVFNVMMYRVMGSQSTTHQLIKQPVDAFSVDEMVTTLRERVAREDYRVFGDAYRVAGYQDEGGADKIENVARMFARIAAQMPEYMRRLDAATGTRAAFDVFKGIPGFGEFLAHQTTVDLLYPPANGSDPVLPFGQDEWAQAGPGARAGIWRMIDSRYKPNNLLMVMQWLRDHQQEQLFKRDLTFPWLDDGDSHPVLLSLCNIQSTLCEFFKYARIWDGDKTAGVRKYDPTQATDPLTGPPVVLDEAIQLAHADADAVTPPPASPETVDEAPELPSTSLDAVGPSAAVSEGFTESLEANGTGLPPAQEMSFELPGGGTVNISIVINVGSR